MLYVKGEFIFTLSSSVGRLNRSKWKEQVQDYTARVWERAVRNSAEMLKGRTLHRVTRVAMAKL